MKKQVKVIALGLIGFAIGFAAGSFFGIQADSANGKGDVSKVNKYYKTSVSPEMSAFQEKIMNDSTAMAQTNVSIALLTSRMVEFSKLVDIAEDATAGKKEFESEIAELKTIQKISENAAASGQNAGESFASVVAGNKDASAAAYEKTSQNLTVAYLMVNRQISVAKEFVAAADNYLAKNGVGNNKNIALARDLWAQYCAGESVLSNDKEEIAYWSKKESVLKGDEFATAYNSVVDSTLQLAVVLDHVCGLANTVCQNPELLAIAKSTIQSCGAPAAIYGTVVYSKDLQQVVKGKELATMVYNNEGWPPSRETATMVQNSEEWGDIPSRETATMVQSIEDWEGADSRETATMVQSKELSTVVNSNLIVVGSNFNVNETIMKVSTSDFTVKSQDSGDTEHEIVKRKRY